MNKRSTPHSEVSTADGPTEMQEVIPISWPAVPTVELVVRLMPAIYSRLPVQIVEGPQHAAISFQGARVNFPHPLNRDGSVSDELLEWLVVEVKKVAAEIRRRMCIVAGTLAVYVEPSGRVIPSKTLPQSDLELTP